MSTKNLADVLFTKTRLAILRELILSNDKSIHLRELARRAGLDASGVRLEIIDISDPLNPIWFGKLTTGRPSRLYVENECVYMACVRNGFQIIQLWD